ncbi:hypothetical protein ACA910_022229 [Epithemia clementina (nom. ined.)]
MLLSQRIIPSSTPSCWRSSLVTSGDITQRNLPIHFWMAHNNRLSRSGPAASNNDHKTLRPQCRSQYECWHYSLNNRHSTFAPLHQVTLLSLCVNHHRSGNLVSVVSSRVFSSSSNNNDSSSSPSQENTTTSSEASSTSTSGTTTTTTTTSVASPPSTSKDSSSTTSGSSSTAPTLDDLSNRFFSWLNWNSDDKNDGDESKKKKRRMSHLLSYSSGRARRRRRQELARERQRQRRLAQKNKSLTAGKVNGDDDDDEDEEEDEYAHLGEDKRTVGDILWPNPWYTEEDNKRWWKEVRQGVWYFILELNPIRLIPRLRLTWKIYLSTWDGFFTQRGLIVYTKEELAEQAKAEEEVFNAYGRGESLDETMTNAGRNAKKNLRRAKTMAFMLHKDFTERTGLKTKDDWTKLSRTAMERFTEIIQHFMAGYRKGRDEEVEKVLTQYFQDFENPFGPSTKKSSSDENDDSNKKKRRRKIKRRRLQLLSPS